MESTVIIDVLSARPGQYEEPKPIKIGLGGESVTIQLSNIPQDMTPTLDSYKERYNTLQQQFRDYKAASFETQNRVVELEHQIATTNDAPRSPLPDESLKELLAFVRGEDCDKTATSLIVVTRLVTGWGAVQAKAFVDRELAS